MAVYRQNGTRRREIRTGGRKIRNEERRGEVDRVTVTVTVSGGSRVPT